MLSISLPNAVYSCTFSSTCDEDYIELYERLDCTGFRLGKVCRPSDFVYYAFENIGCVLYHTGNPSNTQSLTGFELSYTSNDINECLFPFVCQFDCINTPGDYVCDCPKGYFHSPDDHLCFGKCMSEGRRDVWFFGIHILALWENSR